MAVLTTSLFTAMAAGAGAMLLLARQEPIVQWLVCALAVWLLALAAFVVQEGFRTLSVTDDGIEWRGPLRAKAIPWARVVRIDASIVDQRKQDRAGVLAASFGPAGEVAAWAVNAALGDRRTDPFAGPGPNRDGWTPSIAVLGGDGRPLFTYKNERGWPFVDALLVAAEARGIEVRRVVGGE